MRFLALFLLVVAYKFLTNLMHYFRIKKLQTYFSEFLEHKRSDMNLYRQEVLSLFEKAHVKDIKIPVSEHIGNRKIVSGNVSTFSMFPSTRTEFSVTVLNMFEEAEGVFRKNMLDSFNPFYWIDLIVFLPKSLLAYIGISSEVTAYKICNVLVSNHQFNWWFIISPPKGYCYYSPQRAVSQALLLARYKAVLLESSRLDSSACSFIYF